MSRHSSTTCNHDTLTLDPSPHAAEVGYKFRTLQTRTKAAALPSTIARVNKKNTQGHQDPSPSSFPAPLVLPNDELAYDPKCPGQGVASWMKLDSRNPITKERGVIYVAAPPKVDEEVAFVKGWIYPTSSTSRKSTIGKKPSRIKKTGGPKVNDDDSIQKLTSSPIKRPAMGDILDYLSAFYHGIPVKPLPTTLTFTSWEDGEPDHTLNNDRKSSEKPKTVRAPKMQYIALTTDTESVRISCRTCPDKTFPGQINLNDLLDAAEGMLPSDAYALLLVMDHDLFEDDDDDFACGRAYGGSRISVVSTARYNPILDGKLGVGRSHSWPASHCKKYVTDICNLAKGDGTPVKKRKGDDKMESQGSVAMESPMHRAISVISSLAPLPTIGDAGYAARQAMN
ncbi:uncharacterized protein GIQ15_02277 [Arthroderma uncinatum]|uniref:uncharacterized protein n=1 Tax=Arthroderma uncinatum TaxID=74035 RepID=UPI00144A8E99|nr:uncharacterized protein GIQ15_02277 [Arthroderma uncinatum]KAF3482953.1 hypothetical protein GIQ15_02277 [Arthroderma uncinatum]